MSSVILMATVASMNLEVEPRPITPDWVSSGTPMSRTKSLARSRDWTANIVVWECTAGSFLWHYSQDETLFVVSGEAFISNENGTERRLGPGDFGFFPAGSSCLWRVPDVVRKIAIVRETMWRPLGFCLKAWKKLLRSAGMAGKAPL
jgi:uncharacterized cupin superfamily protein